MKKPLRLSLLLPACGSATPEPAAPAHGKAARSRKLPESKAPKLDAGQVVLGLRGHEAELHECFALKSHPRVCEGRLPVKLWLCAPDGKRLESTSDWLAFKAINYPKLKPSLQKKYPGVTWL